MLVSLRETTSLALHL